MIVLFMVLMKMKKLYSLSAQVIYYSGLLTFSTLDVPAGKKLVQSILDDQ